VCITPGLGPLLRPNRELDIGSHSHLFMKNLQKSATFHMWLQSHSPTLVTLTPLALEQGDMEMVPGSVTI
jgi:hypothetical protein